MHVVPPSFLFRYSVPVPRIEPGDSLLETVAPFPTFDDLLPVTDRDPAFGRLAVGWSERGFGIGVEVTGRTQPLYYDVMEPWESDGLTVWIDTRNTGNVHRATRFCHQFHLLPGAAEVDEPLWRQLPIARAKDDAPDATPRSVEVDLRTDDGGYRLEAWFSPAALHGYDPESSPRLGFGWHLRDSELGNRYCTVGPEFPITADPSLWITIELASE